ncbi:hypothetical protein [uncultured Microbacterium sp.]|uniref:hypothetical protein n=1 Tax=uncultured Microbacterium sp. TaxID=191216 RepID=UPI0026026F4A|nr:hypothetical protein [uncultured Microbacterium sp.]
MTTITHDAGVITPQLVDGYQASSEARTIVHPILNRSNPDITFRAPGLRTGSFRCLFPVEADAVAAFAVFRTPQVLTIADDDRPGIVMSFVVADGDISVELDDETRDVWWVEIPFQEVIQ